MKPVDAFRQHIQNLICNDKGARLSSQRELARVWHLSETTVKRVLRPLVENGDLVALPGKGTFVGPLPEVVEESTHETSSESLAAALRSQILSGELTSGRALPQHKYLKAKYGVGQTSVAQAYRILEAQGYAHRIGRQYWVGRFSRTARPSRTALIIARDGTLFYKGSLAPAWRAMERELAVNNYKCLCTTLTEYQQNPTPAESPDACAIEGVTGTNVKEILGMAERLGGRGSRNKVSLLLVGTDVADETRLPRYLNYLCPGTLDKDITRKVCAYIMENGFRGVTLFHDSRHGHADAFRKVIRLVSELRRAQNPASVKIHITPPEGCRSIEALLATDTSFRTNGMDYVLGLMNRYRPMTIESFGAMCTLSDDTEALFRGALDHPLWICTDDATALAALDWCKRTRKKVPDTVAILGLQNSPGSHFHGLSSCTPDYHTIGYLMAHALIGDLALTRTRRGYMHTPVSIIHRVTTP